jgi:hypothetical protein
VIADTPESPASAYSEMQSILPERFFLEPCPLHGVALTVTGRDRVPTQWRLTEELATAISPVLNSRPVKVKSKRFDERNRREST